MARISDFAQTSNFKKAGALKAKTLTVKTSIVTLKPRRYATTGKI